MSRFSLFFTNLWRQKTPRNAATQEKYLPYGDNDSFPLDWAKAIRESPSASACLSTIIDFVTGYDFSDENLAKLVVNSRGETFGDIHRLTVKDDSEFYGFYWHFMYNANLGITEWQVLPFQNCRLGDADSSGWISKIYYNPFFGTDEYKGVVKDNATIVYDAFNPSGIKAQMAKEKTNYKGQVLFIGSTTPLSPYYPVNDAYAVKPWMQIEAGVADYHQDRIDNGFLQDYILVMKGDPNAASNNPDYANTNGPEKPGTVGQEFNDVMNRNFMGRGKHANVMVQWVSNNEEAPTVVPVPNNATSDMFLTLDNQATKKITVGWQVPAILANINEGVSLGGDGNAVRVAVKLMQQRVVRKQRILTDAYGKVLKMLSKPYMEEVDIVPYNPYPELEVVDSTQWDVLTTEEKRQYIKDRSDIELIEETEIEPPPAPTSGQPAPANAVTVTIPNKIKASIERALKQHDELGASCLKPGPRKISEDLLQYKSFKLKDLRRVHNFLKRNEIHKDKPFNEGCEPLQYQAFGGYDMFVFLDQKMKDFDEWLN